jgi:hypothetical protein
MPTPSTTSVPYGFCHCGCGSLAPIAKKDWPRFFHVKGEPTRYILGHVNRQRPVIEEASPFKIDGVYCRLIPLTRGLWAIVDASDYEWLMQWKWYAHYAKHTRGYYAQRMESGPGGKQREVRMHRLILGMERGNPREGDHRNKCGIDNRRKNLRPAGDDENARNSGLRRNNTSGCKGVSWHKHSQKWVARIKVNGKSISLGSFHILSEAKAAYDKAALELHGEFACLG